MRNVNAGFDTLNLISHDFVTWTLLSVTLTRPYMPLRKRKMVAARLCRCKKTDRTEVTVKLLFKLTGSPKYSTALDIVTMKYGKSVTVAELTRPTAYEASMFQYLLQCENTQ